MLILLLWLGVPMFAAMTLLSLGVLWATEGTIASFGGCVFSELDSYLLVAVPLFMLMAGFMVRGPVVDRPVPHRPHPAAPHLLRRICGGIGVATVAACTVFAAISGSSVFTTLTIGKVAIPQVLRYCYSRRGAFGMVAGGGTLGILIPPSAPMVLYAYVTAASVGALFAAGVVPGLMMAAIFSARCMLTECRPVLTDAEGRSVSLTRASAGEMARALRRSLWALTLPPFVLGGIYFGIFTPTEAAGTGVLWALALAALVYRQIDLAAFWDGVAEATRTTAMLFMIIVGASLYGFTLTKLRAPQEVTELVVDLGLGRIGFLLCMAVLLVPLGLILESFLIILLTTPAVLPVLDALAIDKAWYGVLFRLNLELALISPPVALNIVVITAISGAPLAEVNRAVIPYMAMLALGIVLIILVPDIAFGCRARPTTRAASTWVEIAQGVRREHLHTCSRFQRCAIRF